MSNASEALLSPQGAATELQPEMITLSADGRVRLTLTTLLGLSLEHVISGIDDERPAVPRHGAVASSISGYTEWGHCAAPAISIGWDWALDALDGRSLVRGGEPRSNIMLLGHDGRDLGALRTALLIQGAIDAMDWQGVVRHTINTRYSHRD